MKVGSFIRREERRIMVEIDLERRRERQGLCAKLAS